MNITQLDTGALKFVYLPRFVDNGCEKQWNSACHAPHVTAEFKAEAENHCCSILDCVWFICNMKSFPPSSSYVHIFTGEVRHSANINSCLK